MWADSYATAAVRHCAELRAEIEELGEEAVAAEARQLGRLGVFRYIADHRSAVRSYATATPSARRKKRQRLDPAELCRLVLAALFYARWGAIFLDGISKRALEAGLSYRDLHSQACDAAYELLLDYGEWPLEDAPDPFDD